jgi:hypothetical protein
MIVIDIFEENHRFSNSPPHPGLHTLSMRPTWSPAVAPQIDAGAEPASAVCEKEIEMAMLYVFYQGQLGSSNDGQLFYQAFDGNTWYGIQHVAPSGQPVGMSSAPSPVVWNGGLLQVLHQGFGEDGQLWTTWTKDGLNWASEQQPVPNVGMSFSPSAVVFNNKLYVFHGGYGDNGELWYTVADGTSWSQDQQILANVTPAGWEVNNGPMSQSPSAIVWNNVIYVFFQHGITPELFGCEPADAGDGGLYFVASTDGKGWENVDGDHQPTRQLMNVGMSFSPSAVVWRNMIHVFHQGSQQNGQLWYSYHDGQNWQPDQQVKGITMGNPPDADHGYFANVAPMSPSAVVFNNNCYVFYSNADYNLSYVYADGTSWSQEAPVKDVPSECGYAGCVVF